MRPAILALAVLRLLGPGPCAAQGGLAGLVLDESTRRPLAGAHARWEGAADGAVADADGRFSLPMPASGKGWLLVSHAGFATDRRFIDAARTGPEPLRIALARKAVALEPVDIIARPAPEVVYRRADLHVGAFAVNDDGLWVLAYEKPRRWHRQEHAGEQVLLSSRLVLLDTALRERAGTALPAPARRLVQDHARRVIAEGLDEAWLAVAGRDGLRLQRIALDTLRERVLPWTDSLAGRLVGNNRREDFPAFDHFLHCLADDRTALLCSVQDDFMMELFRSQYKYMSGHDKVVAMRLERELGIDREVIAGFMTGFHREPWFKAPYAPLFRVRDTLCVFDHAKGRIRRYLADGSPAGEAPLRHHADRAFRSNLLLDAATERVYAVFRRGPFVRLRCVDPATGALGAEEPITHPYPEELQVHAGHAYYIHRPRESPLKRALYRERLR